MSEEIKSPLEVEAGVNSKTFKEAHEVFVKEVKKIQVEEEMSYLEARKLFFDRRGRDENK